MMMCRIANTTSMSIVIEDLGVRLQPIGGNGSFALVREDMAVRSVDLKRHYAWVKVERFEVVSKDKVQPVPVQVSIPIPVSAPIVASDASDSTEIERLQKTIDGMAVKQEKLFELLSAALSRQGPPVSMPSVKMGTATFSEDPVMIPGHILPDSVEVSVQASERDIDRDDFDSALVALKKARGRV